MGSIGENLRVLRTSAEVTQTALAREMAARGTPFTQQAVDRVERGIRSLRAEEATLIADVLGVPVTVLLASDERGVRGYQHVLKWRAVERQRVAKEARLLSELETVRAAIAAARRKQLLAEAEVNSLGDEGDDDAHIAFSERQQGKRLPRTPKVTGIEPQLEFARGESA